MTPEAAGNTGTITITLVLLIPAVAAARDPSPRTLLGYITSFPFQVCGRCINLSEPVLSAHVIVTRGPTEKVSCVFSFNITRWILSLIQTYKEVIYVRRRFRCCVSKKMEKHPADGEKVRVRAKRRSGINVMRMTKSTTKALVVIRVAEDGRSNTNTKGDAWTTKEFFFFFF